MVSAASYEAIVGTPSTLHGRSDDRTKQAVCRDGKVWARGEMRGPIPSIPCRVGRMTPPGELIVSLRCAAPDSHNHLRRAFGRSRVAPTRKAWASLPWGARTVKFPRSPGHFRAHDAMRPERRKQKM